MGSRENSWKQVKAGSSGNSSRSLSSGTEERNVCEQLHSSSTKKAVQTVLLWELGLRRTIIMFYRVFLNSSTHFLERNLKMGLRLLMFCYPAHSGISLFLSPFFPSSLPPTPPLPPLPSWKSAILWQPNSNLILEGLSSAATAIPVYCRSEGGTLVFSTNWDRYFHAAETYLPQTDHMVHDLCPSPVFQTS